MLLVKTYQVPGYKQMTSPTFPLTMSYCFTISSGPVEFYSALYQVRGVVTRYRVRKL